MFAVVVADEEEEDEEFISAFLTLRWCFSVQLLGSGEQLMAD